MADKKVANEWGAQGTALLPESLRIAWASEALPEWIAQEFGLPPGATAKELDESIWTLAGASALSERQRNFLLNLVQGRRTEIRPLKVFAQPPPYWLNLKDLPFTTRTRNCLVLGGLLGEPDQLSKVTYGRLLDIRSMGIVSILEFACLTEAAVRRANPAKEAPIDVSEALQVISEEWVDQVGPTDPRFADLLPMVSRATLFEILDSLTSGPDADEKALEATARAIPALRQRLREIKALPLEKQLADFLRRLSRYDGERMMALTDRLGWHGTPPITLEEAGKRLGITRERFRQLQERVTDRLREIPFPPYMPALDDALELLRTHSPLGLSAATELLKAHGLTEVDFHPASLIAVAETCGRNPPIRLQSVGQRTMVSATEISNADSILRFAYRQTQASGASNVGEVVAELQANHISSDEATVRHVLRELSDVHFIEEDWFGRRPENPERDRLRNITRKMLSVASPIELNSLREGVRREYRYRGHRGAKTWPLIVPPRSILRGYYHVHPEFLIDEHDQVKSADPLDYRIELALNESILVDVLRSSPACVLDRASLANECARRSMNMNTLSLYLTYSPIIIHLGTDIWSLRGVRVDPAAVDAVRSANALRQKEKRVLDHGWTQNGQLWVATRLPGAHSGNLVFGIPGAIRSYLAGRQFNAVDEAGIPHGTVRINDEGASWGFSSFLRQRGADEGDILVTEFDLSGNAALLRLGNDEMLDEMSPET
jgi:Sigma-70, region 4